MKKLILMIITALIFCACSQDEFLLEEKIIETRSDAGTNQWGPGELLGGNIMTYKKVATKLVESTMPIRVCHDVHQIVQNARQVGLGEVCYVKEAMGDSTKMWQVSLPTTPKYLRDILKFTFDNPKSVDSVFITHEVLDKLQIYWPYSENWDGVTPPVITWEGEKYDETRNFAYYKENGEVKGVLVDEEYAKNNPVWIVNGATYAYSSIPFLLKKDEDGELEDSNLDGSPDLVDKFEINHGPFMITCYKHPKYGVGDVVGGNSSGGKYITDANEVYGNLSYKIYIKNFYVPRAYKPSIFEGEIHFTLTTVAWNSEKKGNVLIGETQDICVSREELDKATPYKRLIIKRWLPKAQDIAFLLCEHVGGDPKSFSGYLHYLDNGIMSYCPFGIGYYENDNIILANIFNRSWIFSNECIQAPNYSTTSGIRWKFDIREF